MGSKADQFPETYQEGGFLGSEYCSGYIDEAGRWNTGFYCPSSDEIVAVFCCGSPHHKYCCIHQDQMVQEGVDGSSMLIGALVGAFMGLLMTVMASCIFCPWCPAYRRRDNIKPRSSWNRLPHADSNQSTVTNIYSQSCDTVSSLPSLHPEDTFSSSFQSQLASQEVVRLSPTIPHSQSQHNNFYLASCVEDYEREQFPPPYHILPRGSYLIIPQDTPDLISESQIQENLSMEKVEKEELLYSTKF